MDRFDSNLCSMVLAELKNLNGKLPLAEMVKVGLRVDLFPLATVRVYPFGRFDKRSIDQGVGNVHEKRKDW